MVAVLVLLMAQLVSSAVVKPEARLQPPLDSSQVIPGVQWCSYVYYCPSCTSCCRRADGTYGCCGNNMVCCPDGFHCCPYGSRCDATSSHCLFGGSRGLSFLSSPQQPATMVDTPKVQLFPRKPEAPQSALESAEPSVQWCDFKTYCPDCSTCCRTPSGSWSCCVFSNGQCCPDGLHCCANGYRCDSKSSRCLIGGLSLPSSPQRPAITANSTVHRDYEEVRSKLVKEAESSPMVPVNKALETPVDAEIVRCDARSGCPAGSTCCKMLNGEWGCCPYTEGQCCEDGKHCCESGFECDGSVSCKKGLLSVPAGLKEAPLNL
ncbi:progranulin-like [Pygocentrus nattereri]|uniref:progranulin-like n=1 Tax=Pygocentrus nattereri TaxID=42514 RepID=UPI00081490C2|nr:progranulin-like [Pygocentrus nattereri]